MKSLDATALGLDLGALAAPFIPGGAGRALAVAGRAGQAAGGVRNAQATARAAAGAARGTGRVVDVTDSGLRYAQGRSRGGENSTTVRGREAHEEFKQKVKAKGWDSEPRIFDPATGKYYKPDAITKSGRPVELKPRTPSGKRQGRSQLRIYERLTGKKGRVVYYDP